MRVYRYLDEIELGKFECGQMDELGELFPKKTDNSTHKNRRGVKYIHFFKNIDDLDYIRRLKSKADGTFYICQFNINPITLIKYAGTGFYDTSRYDNIDIEKIREYAIPVDEIEPDYLKFYIKDANRDITADQAYERFNTGKCTMPIPKVEQQEQVEEVETNTEQPLPARDPLLDIKVKIATNVKSDDVCQ